MLINAIMTLFRGGSIDIWSVVAYILSVLFIIVLILPLHEFAHGFIANKLGDPTAKLEGRLTFNPLASVDPMGALWLLLFGFGWAKPVPVDPRYFKKPRRDMALVALAGPVSNLLASLVGGILLVCVVLFLPVNSFVSFLTLFLQYYVTVNISIAVFNLLPIPPLDGSRIVAAFLPQRALSYYYRYQNIIVMVLFVLMISGAFSGPLGVAQNFFYNIVMTIAQAPFKLFGAL